MVRDTLPVPAWLEGRGGQPEGCCHRQMLDAVFCITDNGGKWRSVLRISPHGTVSTPSSAGGAEVGRLADLAARIAEAPGNDRAERQGRHPSG
ncbi:hypothetical protein ABZ851_31880 [Streptomyces sp. NPDC047049]|uniref:hypothetical protein n=1 Tax=Streptomyces sp. NPDC047049 TaxID=3156688 RepID=UPI0033C09E4E